MDAVTEKSPKSSRARRFIIAGAALTAMAITATVGVKTHYINGGMNLNDNDDGIHEAGLSLGSPGGTRYQFWTTYMSFPSLGSEPVRHFAIGVDHIKNVGGKFVNTGGVGIGATCDSPFNPRHLPSIPKRVCGFQYP
ncbi:MAG: hypothetical protein WDO70_02480 [Alphaproteobacteria bacterium]